MKDFLYCFVIFGCLICLHELNKRDREQQQAINNLQQQVATFKNIHICEDRSHETCDGDCDCDGIACDTL